MKKQSLGGTLAVMIFGFGPIALFTWIASDISGGTIIIFWIIAGVILHIYMNLQENH
jgi:hypothetical protein